MPACSRWTRVAAVALAFALSATHPAAAAMPVADLIPSPVKHCASLTIPFEFDEARVPVSAQPELAALAECLVRSGQKVTIEGHAEEHGTPEYALATSERRAKAVAAALTALGVPAERVATRAYGRERPLCTEPTEACRAKNRRVEVVPE